MAADRLVSCVSLGPPLYPGVAILVPKTDILISENPICTGGGMPPQGSSDRVSLAGIAAGRRLGCISLGPRALPRSGDFDTKKGHSN